jgi:hypothetical protein
MLRDALLALSHAARRKTLSSAVFAAEDAGVNCAAILATIILQNRDNEVRLVLQHSLNFICLSSAMTLMQ